MKNKQQPPKFKDPKKVAAGKARAAKAIRIDGKFTTNVFLEEVERLAKNEGVKDPFEFYLQNEKELSSLYKIENLSTNQSYDNIRQAIKNFKGKVYKNGRQVKKETLLRSISSLNQFLKTEYNVVQFWQKLNLGFTGKLKMEIPTPAEIQEAAGGMETGEFVAIMQDEFNIGVIISDTKGKEDIKQKGTYQERKEASRKKYNESAAGKEAKRKWRQTEKAKEAKKAYKKTAAGKAEKARYRQTEAHKTAKIRSKQNKKK